MKTLFLMKGYAPRLALKKSYKTTRKWPILKPLSDRHFERAESPGDEVGPFSSQVVSKKARNNVFQNGGVFELNL